MVDATPQTLPEVRQLTAGAPPNIDKYMRAHQDGTLKGKPNQLWSVDDAEYTSIYAKFTTAAEPGDPDLTDAAKAEVARWCGGDQRYVRFRWDGEPVITMPDSDAPRKRMKIVNLNSAGTANDLSDNAIGEFQIAQAKLGVKPEPEMPRFAQFDFDPHVEAGRVARVEGRRWEDGDLFNTGLIIGSLEYPIILPPIKEEEAAPETEAGA